MTAVPAERPPTPDELAELLQPGADWERDGFHPTMNRPFPSMQCTGVVKSGPRAGNRCSNRALYGATVCLSHGATLPSVRNKAAALVESARLRLISDVDVAVDYLEDLAANSTSDAVRLKATTEILDRAGVRGGVELDVSVEAKLDPATVLRQRIATTRQRIIEAELVDTGDTVAEDAPPVTAEEEPTDGQP